MARCSRKEDCEYGDREKLKDARMKSGFTQETVAEKINVSRQTISNWENENLIRILSASLR